MIKVSVIIPVYNMEKYLEKCVESLLAQTLRELEIIFVDDGSTDNSRAILERYARENKNIYTVFQEHSGSQAARKRGTEEATGIYIGYVDSDDYIDPVMYQRLYEAAVESKVDLVSAGYVLEGNYVSECYDGVEQGIYQNERMGWLREHTIFNLSREDLGLRGSLCCKLFRRELMQQVMRQVPAALSFSEDKMCVLTYVLECSSVEVLYEAYYHYKINQASMTNSVSNNYLMRVQSVQEYLESLYTHPLFTEGMRIQAELYVVQQLIKGINSRMGFLNSNLLWIDPDWMDGIPERSKVFLYGAGALGKKYYQQIQNSKKLIFAGCMDFAYETMAGYPFEVKDPEKWKEYDFDLVVITLKDSKKAEEIKKKLCNLGMDRLQIYHFEQKEIFWKFAKADGLLGKEI